MENLEYLDQLRKGLKEAVEQERAREDELWEALSQDKNDFKTHAAYKKQRETTQLAIAAFKKANEAYLAARQRAKEMK